nr:hypothetical protein [Tanacetum cinerariifolium]
CSSLALDRGKKKVEDEIGSLETRLNYVSDQENFRERKNVLERERDLKSSCKEKMLKALISNKEKLLELANTPLNKNCSAVILKKLPEKLGDPRKFLILCGFSKLKYKALSDLAEIARDVFVSVRKFTFPAEFVIVDYESDPRVPLILGRPFLQTARALIDVYEEEMILRDGDERLTLNMRHATSSYSNQPQKKSINMINIFNDSYEGYLKDLFATNHLSGNPTFSSHTDLTSPEVDALPSTDNEDKVFNSGILIHESLSEVTVQVTQDRNVKKISISHASLILEDFNSPLSDHELPFHKEFPGSETLLSFLFENEEKVFKPGILTSKGVQTSLISKLSNRGPKAFKVIKIFESPMEIFPCSYGEDICILNVSCLHFYPP